MELKRAWLMLAATGLLVTGCGGSNDDTATGGLTADEASQLNDAAQMLDVPAKPPASENAATP